MESLENTHVSYSITSEDHIKNNIILKYKFAICKLNIIIDSTIKSKKSHKKQPKKLLEKPSQKLIMNQIEKAFGKPYTKPFDKPVEKPVQKPVEKPVQKPVEKPVCYCMGCSITGNCMHAVKPEFYIEDMYTLKKYKTFSEYLMGEEEVNIKEEEIIPECCKKEMNDYEYIHHMTYYH